MINATCAGLLAALKIAAAGAVLGLPAGNCNPGVISNINPAGPVTITSQNTAAPTVIVGGFHLGSSSNLTFTGLSFAYTTADDAYWALRVSGVKDITFTKNDFGGPGSTLSEPGGFYIADSDHVSFTNNTFHDTPSVALDMLRVTNTVIDSNDFTRWGKSAVGVGSVQTFAFINNSVHDAFPGLGTHADGLQVLTGGTTTQSNGLTISGNHMWTGAGWAFQGIFVQDDLNGAMPILNVTASNNLLYGTMWDSLWFKYVGGKVSITNNLAVSWPQRDVTGSPSLTAPIITPFTANFYTVLAPGAVATITGNAAQSFSDQAGKYVAALPGNTLLAH